MVIQTMQVARNNVRNPDWSTIYQLMCHQPILRTHSACDRESIQQSPRWMPRWCQHLDSSRQQLMQPWTIQQTFSVSHCLSIIHMFCTTISVPPHARSPVDSHLNNASSQQQYLKPRLVHNPSTCVSQTDPEDACHLQSRIYPAVPSMIEQMTTMTSASARLVAAEEGLVGKCNRSVFFLFLSNL